MMRNQKGVAMLIVISLILMLLILGGAVLMVSTGHFGTSFHQIRRANAYYAAEAAMQHALYQLRTGKTALPAPDNSVTVPFPDANGINGIPAANIGIVVEDVNQTGEQPEGVHPIKITVNY